MRIRHLIAALAVICAAGAAVPAAASASWEQEMRAASRLEQAVTRKYPRFNFSASCDQMNPGRYWCSLFGHSGDCYRSAKANVRAVRRGYTVTWAYWLYGMTRTCY